MSEDSKGSFFHVFILIFIGHLLIGWAQNAKKEVDFEHNKAEKAAYEAQVEGIKQDKARIRGFREPKTDPYIDIVKKGVLKLDPSVSVGDAFDGYDFFQKTSWKSFVSDQNRRVVEMSGMFDFDKFAGTSIPEAKGQPVLSSAMVYKAKQKLNGVGISYVIQFAIAKDNASFEIKFSGIEIEKAVRPDKETFQENGISILERIFANKPAPTVWLILASNSK